MSEFVALDIGNSSVKLARHDGTAWQEAVRFDSNPATPPEAWQRRMETLLAPADAVGLCSVVPALTPRLTEAVESVTGRAPYRVLATGRLPLRMGYETPETLGADRVAAAVAAWGLYAAGRPVVAFDAGTAITVEVVDVDAEGPIYQGGAILPGPTTLLRALAGRTAQLPEVDWERPGSPIGRTTTTAIQAGLATLALDGLGGLLRRTAEALSAPPVVVATGGWGGWLARRLPESGVLVDHVAPSLVLDGIRLLAQQERG